MKFSELQRLQRMEGITVLSADERIEQLEARLRTITKERDALRARIAEMEKQEPVGTTGGMPGTTGFTMACFHADKVPIGSKLYALPGAKGEDK